MSLEGRSPLRINAIFTFKANEPLLTVGQLKDFICNYHLEDYTFTNVDPKEETSAVAGCRHWCTCLLGELEVDKRVPGGSTEDLVRFIKNQSDIVGLDPEDDHPYIPMPTTLGVFSTAQLRYPRSRERA